jgi:drug/metabolite transporter (DMT)-like permease
VQYLLLVSVIWSASFGIFKTYLSGLDADLMAFLRIALALLVFLPFIKAGGMSRATRLKLTAVGAIEFGMMYVFLNESYAYLDAWQVALMTLFTPVYIILIDGIVRRRIDWVIALCVLLAVAGAGLAMMRCGCISLGSLKGCLLVQASDICFATGQLAYKRLKLDSVPESGRMGWMFSGALAVSAMGTLIAGSLPQVAVITGTQWLAIVYMGTVSTALCFFWWNMGVTRVQTGILAVLSNVKVPMAVAVSLLLFGESAGDWRKLLSGTVLMVAAVVIAQRRAEALAAR